jgi:hypothetical protein
MRETGTRKGKWNYTTAEKRVSRWFSFLSGTLTTLAGGCVGDIYPLTGDANQFLVTYNIGLLIVFFMLGAIFYKYKKALNSAVADETKDGLTGLTPSEGLALTVDEGITNLAAAIASLMAQNLHDHLYFWDDYQEGQTIVVSCLVGCVVLLLGEYIQRLLTKGSMVEYIVNMFNGLNVGSVAWWVGYDISSLIQTMSGTGPVPKEVGYWMWLVTLFFALVFMEFVHSLSANFRRGTDGKPYGHILLTAVKSIPMYASGFVLYNIEFWKYKDNYVLATLILTIVGSVGVVSLEQLIRKPCFKVPSNYFAADAKLESYFMTQTVTLLQHTFAFVAGQLGTIALTNYVDTVAPDGVGSRGWLTIGFSIQVLAFAIESARTRCLPKVLKDAATPASELVNELSVNQNA